MNENSKFYQPPVAFPERISFFEAERDRVVSEACSTAKKKEARAFYDKLIASLKEKT